MNIRIIGAVAAGTSAAAKARRNTETADIRIFEMDTRISYSACGLPYWLGGEVEDLEQLAPRDPAYFKSKYNVDVLTEHQVLHIDPDGRKLEVRNTKTGEIFSDPYDKLIIATGAASIVPSIPGAEHPNVFTIRNVGSMEALDAFIREANPKNALIAGTGFIGMEMAESLSRRGLAVTMVEMEHHPVKQLDADVAVWLQDTLQKNGVSVYLSEAVASLEWGAGRDMSGFEKAGQVVGGLRMTETGKEQIRHAILKSGKIIETDLVLLAVGIRPNVALAREAGVRIGRTGAIAVDERMMTNISDVYACGDCAESFSPVTGKPFWHPLGSTANKMGRIAGDQASGGSLTFRGTLGTGIFRIFDTTVAMTGLSEREAKLEGFDTAVCHNIKPDKPEYFHGEEMLIKAVADRATGRLLGAQIIGKAGVDKRIDVMATAISFGAKAEDLMHLDLAYAPPYSTTKDPVIYTGMILANDLSGYRPLMTADTLLEKLDAGQAINVVDARIDGQYRKDHVPTAQSLPQDMLRDACPSLDPDVTAVTYCNKGVTGNAAQGILKNLGIRTVYNLSGGNRQFEKVKAFGKGKKEAR
jgi:NADPH-dependent 2,4-dienoyl-CoA reductase/sulfur reductase-like enzyme/rhodanese-related sulfurtransferase